MSILENRKQFSPTTQLALNMIGLLIFVAIWWIVAEAMAVDRPVVDYTTRLPSSVGEGSEEFSLQRDSILRADSIAFANATETEKVYPLLPTPLQTVRAFPTLFRQDELVLNSWISIWRNLQGYFWAVSLSLLLGFTIGLVPLVRQLFSKQVDALRYLPLTAVTGLFILWFGIGDTMKVAFLAFGILVYLLPVVVQRIDEVGDVYKKTAFTLGATDWQLVRTVYGPSVLSKLIDDIRVLTAISWTYIIIAELLNRDGGLGALLYLNGRQGQVAKVFALLIVIVLIGFVQDRLFLYLDRRLFPGKYVTRVLPGQKESEMGVLVILGTLLLYLVLGAFLPLPAVAAQLVLLIVAAAVIIILYGEFKTFQSRKLA